MSSQSTSAQPRLLICGSLAFDTIMVFHDRFKAHILPDKLHMLNVAFLVPTMRREFGGCAGNIAYNSMLLGDSAYPMATAGSDFAPYADWMRRHGVPQDYVRIIDSAFTAQAFITTDLDDNQITAFHPGAMQQSHLNQIADAGRVTLGIVSPDGREGMIAHATQFAAAGIPFIFDPGQGLPMYGREDLQRFIEQASWVTVNDYEWSMIQQKTGWSERDVLAHVQALIVTRGADGSLIHTPNGTITIAAAPVQAVVDPTGCGDAYRAGLMHGLSRGLDWPTTGRIAALVGAYKIESLGPQNHRFTRAEFAARYQQSFGAPLPATAL
jgi:adenosine kinase